MDLLRTLYTVSPLTAQGRQCFNVNHTVRTANKRFNNMGSVMFWVIIINVMVCYHYHKVDSGFSRDFFFNLFVFKGNIKFIYSTLIC